MLDQQLAVTLSQQKGLGLSEVLIRQLSPQSSPTASASGEKRETLQGADKIQKWQAEASADSEFTSPQAFIKRLAHRSGCSLKPRWKAAGDASPRVLPMGKVVTIYLVSKPTTTEYQNGKAARQTEKFRAYPSFVHSFADYLDFLQSNPRYKEALQRVNDPEQFIDALQQAGYASDPNYADKVKKMAKQIAELISLDK